MQFYIHNSGRPSENIGEPLLLYTCKIGRTLSGYPRRLHSHQDMLEFLYVQEGSGIYLIDGQKYTVHAGDLVIYNSGVLHDERWEQNPLPILCCGATGIHIQGRERNQLIPPHLSPVIPLGKKATAFHSLFEMLYSESYEENVRSVEICHSLFAALLRMILNVLDRQSPEICENGSQTQPLGMMIKEYVNAHALDPITLLSVSRQFQISVSYLSHLFKETTGFPLVQYVIRRRVGEAQTLLISTNRPITEIARRVGYENLSYFVKLFTRSVGMSPRKYRKSYRGQEFTEKSTRFPLS